jgi:hypothetical protein
MDDASNIHDLGLVTPSRKETAIFRRLVVLLDQLVPRQGIFVQALTLAETMAGTGENSKMKYTTTKESVALQGFRGRLQ